MGRTLSDSNIGERGSADGLELSPFQRILLVGFMGSGKTTLGRLLASEMGWRFVDLDEAVELHDGREISRIFQEDGEEGFRKIEHAVTLPFLGEDRVVLASGGGWPCQEGRLEGVGPGTLSVWLRVSSEEALDRIRRQGTRRPLLEVPNPLTRIGELLAVREPYYRKASCWVDTELHPLRAIVRRVIDCLLTDSERPLQV